MVGEIVTHYKILEKLGGGGMGIVFKAQDIILERLVALKFLPHVYSFNEDFKQNIIREAKIAATLDHPNICTIHEVGETEDGQIFIAMAYYEGETLKKKINKKLINESDIESIVLQIAKGLETAHKKGIVHKDIKPENIFITQQNEVKILDFGVAKVQGEISVLDAEKVQGTIAYMSPEQISGEEIDERTDIWAYGVLLYELTTGKKPFSSEYEQTALYSILNEDPDLSEISEDRPENSYLQEIIQKCIAKEKELRFQSFSEIILILDPLIYAEKKGKNRFMLNVTIAILAVLMIILTGYIFIPQFRSILRSVKISKTRIAVLPFSHTQTPNDTTDYQFILQSLIATELSNNKELGVVDPTSINGLVKSSLGNMYEARDKNFYESLTNIDIKYVIDGTVRTEHTSNVIETNILDPFNAEIKYSFRTVYKNNEDFIETAKSISNQLLNYFQVHISSLGKDKNLTPWLESNCTNMMALKSFILASQKIYRQERGADIYLKKAIEHDSCFISPRVWLISHLGYKGNLKEARKHLAVLKSLEDRASLFDQAMIDWADGFLKNDISAQISSLSIALEYSPNNNILLYNLARLYYLMDNYPKALATINITLEMNWNYSLAYLLAGLCYYKLGHIDESKEILEKSLDIKPVYEQIYTLLAAISLVQNDSISNRYYEDQYLTKVQEFGLSEEESYWYVADFYKGEKLYKNAARVFRKVISFNPDSSIYHESLAGCLIKMGDTTSAEKEYLMTVQLDSLNPNIQFILGNIFLKKNQIDKARNQFMSYINIDSTSSRADSVKEILKQLGHADY